MVKDKRILVTGMSGLIGGIAGRKLMKKYEVRALNRRDVPGVETFQADITDLEAIRPSFKDVDIVVHMAAYLGNGNTPEQINVNIWGTYNVFEAAREAGVKRIVFGSSGAVMHNYERDEPYKALVEARYHDIAESIPMLTHLSPTRPNSLYGCAKLWGEALGRYYAEDYGISVLCIRLGRVVEEDKPYDARHAAVYLSHRDTAQIIEKCVEAPDDLMYDIFYGISDNRTRFRDLVHARDVIGFIPQDGIRTWPEEDA
ncbi:MAG: NAD(P)-dependent oxidoreductase [Anaerolineae bacterium]|nr:NAD(P)-dependent oxidoreductase [Anaerolineae bacterium]